MEKGSNQEFLRVKIDLPGFKAEMSTRKPLESLGELRRILERIHGDDDALYEEYAMQELRQTFSERFTGNESIMQAVRDLLKQEEEYVAQAIAIPTDTDTTHNDGVIRVQRQDVQQAINGLMARIETKAVKRGIIHLSGSLERHDKLLILDHIHQSMPTAQLRAFHSDGDSVMVECVFFGEFKRDEE